MGVWIWPRVRDRLFPNWKGPAADPPREFSPPPSHPAPPVATAETRAALIARLNKYMPRDRGQGLDDLILVYAQTAIEFPQLKGITIAQWCYESAWGKSSLCRRALNYGGMKWSPADAQYGGAPENRTGFDGYEHNVRYTKFPTYQSFIAAYWARLDRVGAYRGWRNNTSGPEAFFRSIGPPWVGYEAQKYVYEVLKIYNNHIKFIIA